MKENNHSVNDEVSHATGESIKLGSCGWNHAHWQASFYPDDLPSDWRLSYYANEFSAVLLAENQWRDKLMALEEWAFDVDENFRFFLQCSTPLAPAEQKKLVETLGDKLGAVVSTVPGSTGIEIDEAASVAVIRMASQDMRGWRAWLEQHSGTLRAIFLNDKSLSYSQMSDFKALLELMGL